MAVCFSTTVPGSKYLYYASKAN